MPKAPHDSARRNRDAKSAAAMSSTTARRRPWGGTTAGRAPGAYPRDLAQGVLPGDRHPVPGFLFPFVSAAVCGAVLASAHAPVAPEPLAMLAEWHRPFFGAAVGALAVLVLALAARRRGAFDGMLRAISLFALVGIAGAATYAWAWARHEPLATPEYGVALTLLGAWWGLAMGVAHGAPFLPLIFSWRSLARARFARIDRSMIVSVLYAAAVVVAGRQLGMENRWGAIALEVATAYAIGLSLWVAGRFLRRAHFLRSVAMHRHPEFRLVNASHVRRSLPALWAVGRPTSPCILYRIRQLGDPRSSVDAIAEPVARVMTWPWWKPVEAWAETTGGAPATATGSHRNQGSATISGAYPQSQHLA